jgi:DHA1 family bicyclomycin/chloramphenicol resistance-like MFS transporter
MIVGLLGWSTRMLPETLPVAARQSLRPKHLVPNYFKVLRHPDFLLLAAIPALNFAGFFLYVASAPAFLIDLLGISTYGFAWLFGPLIAGVMLGAYTSGRVAGRLSTKRTIGMGYALMLAGAMANLLVCWLVTPGMPWNVLPLMLYMVGSSIVMPSATLLLLDLFPTMRGLVSSLQGFVQFGLAAFNAGTISPLLARSLQALALGMGTFLLLSLSLWLVYLRRAKSHARP